ncbi:hypothetical protein [Kribbella sp. NPDC023855]|uniref:hypothetical protein n=1 Tax=Kribbella sp. NPDC023855 TaxID=3154698 RepID=UPI0033E537C6
MAKLVASVPIERPEAPLVVAAIPRLLQRARALSFGDGGFLVHDGRRIEGLHLDAGEHPRVGARYTMVSAIDADQPVKEPVAIELTADDSTQFAIRLRQAAVDGSLAVTRPMDPQQLRVEFRVMLPDIVKLLSGPIDGGATVAFDGLPPAPGTAPQVVGTVLHKFARAELVVRIDDQDSRTSLLTASLTVRGRGLLRPVLGPAAQLFLRSHWQQAVRRVPAELAKFQQELRNAGGPDELAAALLQELIDDLAPELPAHSA